MRGAILWCTVLSVTVFLHVTIWLISLFHSKNNFPFRWCILRETMSWQIGVTVMRVIILCAAWHDNYYRFNVSGDKQVISPTHSETPGNDNVNKYRIFRESRESYRFISLRDAFFFLPILLEVITRSLDFTVKYCSTNVLVNRDRRAQRGNRVSLACSGRRFLSEISSRFVSSLFPRD